MEETMQGNSDDGSPGYAGHWRMAAWAAAAVALLVPLALGAPWTSGDYVLAGALLFVPLGIYEIVARTTGDPAYRTGTGMALVGAALLLWVSGAVGITDSDADMLYVLALGAGGVGTFVAGFRPLGMARAMLATALALLLSGAGALIAGAVPPHNSALEILGLTGLFAALFAGSALLFWKAARRGPEDGAAECTDRAAKSQFRKEEL